LSYCTFHPLASVLRISRFEARSFAQAESRGFGHRDISTRDENSFTVALPLKSTNLET
jgi:hypothetical protein